MASIAAKVHEHLVERKRGAHAAPVSSPSASAFNVAVYSKGFRCERPKTETTTICSGRKNRFFLSYKCPGDGRTLDVQSTAKSRGPSSLPTQGITLVMSLAWIPILSAYSLFSFDNLFSVSLLSKALSSAACLRAASMSESKALTSRPTCDATRCSNSLFCATRSFSVFFLVSCALLRYRLPCCLSICIQCLNIPANLRIDALLVILVLRSEFLLRSFL